MDTLPHPPERAASARAARGSQETGHKHGAWETLPSAPASHSGRAAGPGEGSCPSRQVHRGGDSSRLALTLVQTSPPCGGGWGGRCAPLAQPHRSPTGSPQSWSCHAHGTQKRARGCEDVLPGPVPYGQQPRMPSSACWARGCCASPHPPPDFLLWSPGGCWLDWGMNALRNGKFSLESSWGLRGNRSSLSDWEQRHQRRTQGRVRALRSRAGRRGRAEHRDRI